MDSVQLDQFEAWGATTFDQLTSVRNYVRQQTKGAREPVGAEVEVLWPDGLIETLRFDQSVGYPLGTGDKDWIAEWRSEVVQ